MLSASRRRRAARRTALGAAILALLLAVGVATAAAPSGPRLAVVKRTWKPVRLTLLTVGPRGGRPVRIAGGQRDGSFGGAPLSWRPDGGEIAVTGIGEFFLARADGSGARSVNAANAELPVFSPDGHTIAFTRSRRFDEAAIWTIDLRSGEQRQLTPSRRGLRHFPSSFSPDGTTLLTTRFDSRRGGDGEMVALRMDGDGATRLVAEGIEPVYSPDGSEIAFFREAGRPRAYDLFVLSVSSGATRRLTRTPRHNEIMASWDPSGERIAFARFRGYHFEWANSIVQINADGSCETEMLARKRTIFYGPAWQPGPGREAGRIECRGRGHR